MPIIEAMLSTLEKLAADREFRFGTPVLAARSGCRFGCMQFLTRPLPQTFATAASLSSRRN
jgi:hypothetical protein